MGSADASTDGQAGGAIGQRRRRAFDELTQMMLAPGSDGDTRPGRRRASFTWFDTSRAQLLRQAEKLNGDVVTGSLSGADASADTIAELRHLARRWPPPWRQAMDRTLDRREFVATPVAEYLPARLIRASAA